MRDSLAFDASFPEDADIEALPWLHALEVDGATLASTEPFLRIQGAHQAHTDSPGRVVFQDAPLVTSLLRRDFCG